MNELRRVQRKRTKGWKMPENTVYVGRPTRWGNPFRVGGHYKRDAAGGIPRLGLRFTYLEASEGYQDSSYTTIRTREEACEWYRWYQGIFVERLAELRGKNLACWCPLDQHCHADVLLELANGRSRGETEGQP